MTDGSFCPKTGAGGYGFWIASERGKMPGGGPLKGICADSTEVEMKAVCNSLAASLYHELILSGDEVLIQLDSKNAIAAFEGKRIPGMEEELRVVETFKGIVETYSLTIEFRHVKAHSPNVNARNAANNHCDRRAKRGMGIRRRELQNV